MSLPEHHAFVAYGQPSKLTEFAAYIARELGVSAVGNPDFHIRDYSSGGDSPRSRVGEAGSPREAGGASLDVDEARALTKLSDMHGVGGVKVFVLGANTITREAQNALLKTLEEPTEGTIFAFLVPRGSLIQTVHSRLMELPWSAKQIDDSLAKEYLQAPAEKRTTLIANILKEKDKEKARDLLDSIERLLRQDIQKVEVQTGLIELNKMRSYLMDRSPSLKMILEHLNLVIPQVK